MNRHLHNTLCALATSGSLLVFGLIAAAPLMPHDASVAPQTLLTATSGDPTPAGVVVANIEAAEATAVVMVANAIEQAAAHTIDTAPPRTTRSSQRQRRQALVMPYLSFVPRG